MAATVPSRTASPTRSPCGSAAEPGFARRQRPRGKPTVADILRRYVPSYLARFGWRVTAHQRSVLEKLMRCRTPAYGGHAWECQACSRLHYSYDSCRNRHCPTCGGSERHLWLERMLDWSRVLPTSYLHVVLTLPHELCGLIGRNPRALYRLFFDTASQTLLTLGRERLGLQLGLVLVLHSWGQRTNHHVHLHVLVTAGGPALDGKRWIPVADRSAFVAEELLGEQLRQRYMAGLERLFRQRKLDLPRGLAWIKTRQDLRGWLAPLQAKPWHVHCQDPPAHCRGPEAVLKYLANYVTGVAIHDGRIIEDDGTHVTFMAKNYRRGTRGPLKVSGQEFVRRFLTHILPSRMRRIRYAGLFAPGQREQRLQLCGRLLAEAADTPWQAGKHQDSDKKDDAGATDWLGDDDLPTARRCPHCGGSELAWLGKMTAAQIAGAQGSPSQTGDSQQYFPFVDRAQSLPRPDS